MVYHIVKGSDSREVVSHSAKWIRLLILVKKVTSTMWRLSLFLSSSNNRELDNLTISTCQWVYETIKGGKSDSNAILYFYQATDDMMYIKLFPFS